MIILSMLLMLWAIKKKMHTERRYATCSKGMSKIEKMHAQRRYATCSQGMSIERKKNVYNPYL